MLKAYASLIGATLIVGFSFAFVKISLESASVFESLAHRFSVAFLAVLALVKFGVIKAKFSVADFKQIAFIAILYPSSFFVFQAFGLELTSSLTAGILHACTPIETMVFAQIFLKERISLAQKSFIYLSVFGVVYMLMMSENSDLNSSLLGNFFILISTLAISLYNVFARKILVKFEISKLVAVTVFIGFICFNGLNLIDFIANGRDLRLYFATFLDLKFSLVIAFLAIFSSVGTSFLFAYALKRLEAFKVGIFSNLSTLVTIIAGMVLLKESFEIYHFTGSVLIILGAAGVNLLNLKGKFG